MRSIQDPTHTVGRVDSRVFFDHWPITIVWIKLTWPNTITYSAFDFNYNTLPRRRVSLVLPAAHDGNVLLHNYHGWILKREPQARATLHWPSTTLPLPLTIAFNIDLNISQRHLALSYISETFWHSAMLHLSRRAIPGALNGKFSLFIPSLDPSLLITTSVRTHLISGLPQSTAPLSTSSIKSATALERQGQPGQPLTASGKERKEVPLPSQEKKEGAMQYVLFVSRTSIGYHALEVLIFSLYNPGPRSIKWPTGLVRVPCGQWHSVLPAALLRWCICQPLDTIKTAWVSFFGLRRASRMLWLSPVLWRTRWLLPFDKFTIKCPTLAGLSAWAVVQMVVVIITTVTLLSEAVIE